MANNCHNDIRKNCLGNCFLPDAIITIELLLKQDLQRILIVYTHAHTYT